MTVQPFQEKLQPLYSRQTEIMNIPFSPPDITDAEIAAMYDRGLKDLNVTSLKHRGKDFVSSCHLYLVRLNGYSAGERDRFIAEMARRGIATNVHYKPLPMHTAYRNLGFDIADYPCSYSQFANEVTLPLNTCLTDDQVNYIIRNFRETPGK